MKYKWASTKTNPAARYFPQAFSVDEERLLYRCLSGAADKPVESRGAAAGVLTIKGKVYVSMEQDAVFKALRRDSDDVVGAVTIAIERNKGRKPIRAHKWLVNQGFDVSTFDDWWKKMARLPFDERKAAVDAFTNQHVSKQGYGNPVKSVIVGFFARDSKNPWGRQCDWITQSPANPNKFQKVLPLIRRIDEAFRLSVPERYEAQKRFCDRLDPRFVIASTCFTTITVNKNFRTYAHRDSGDLSQGLSNLAVFSNGREFKGGHLVLPEFNVEFALRPRDLLFIANREYIHSNTAIEAVHPESERISIVCYAREDLAFCGTVEYEQLRKQFKGEAGLYKRMWDSPRWHNYLMRELGYPTKSLIEKARLHNLLNPEILNLAAKFSVDPWREKWEYTAKIPVPPFKQRQALRALISAIHFKTPRQDKWGAEDGPVDVKALYLNADRWAIAYCESKSGAVKLPNNRFNVQAVGHLPFVPPVINRLSKDLCEWLEARWEAGESVQLVRWATDVSEAPYRMGLTTIREGASAAEIEKVTEGTAPELLYESAGGLAERSSWRAAPKTDFFYDLGWSRRAVRRAVLSTEGEPICDAIQMREDYEIDFLEQEVTHWMKRAKNLGSDDFKTRYERIGTYALPSKLDKAFAGGPWKVDAKADEISISRRLHRGVEKRVYPAKSVTTKLSWSSPYQSLPVLGSNVVGATLILWRYKDNVGGGQVVVTNGDNYWLFQAIGSNKPITRHNRGTKILKVAEPVIVGHLQRSEIVIKPDKSKLVDGIRKRAEFVPSPFAEMSDEKLAGYQSQYQRGRANMLVVAGEQATGKSFVLKQVLARANDWKPGRFGKVLDYTYSKKLNLYVLGVYKPGEKFPGTDRLSRNVKGDWIAFVNKMAPEPVNIVFEGERLLVKDYLYLALAKKTNLAILRFRVSEELKKQRHIDRQDTQKEKELKAMKTKVENICQSPEFWDCVEEVRNESAVDSHRILKMMEWFLSDRGSGSKQTASVVTQRKVARWAGKQTRRATSNDSDTLAAQPP